MEKRKSQLLTTPPLVSQWFGSEYLRRRLYVMNKIDHDARLIALRLLRPQRPGFESSPVFQDLYEIARDVLVCQGVRKKT
jgi:hypothetical protein